MTHTQSTPQALARRDMASSSQPRTSEGTQSAVRVLRLCNSRHAHVAMVPMPWRNT